MNSMTLAERIRSFSPRQREALRDRLEQDAGAAPAQLVAYVTAKAGDAPDAEGLRNFLRDRLPEFMVPSTCIVLNSFPLTPNGKVDRAALPSGDRQPTAERRPVRPANPTQATLAIIWQETLRIEPPGIHDNFFRLGGHSLVALQVLARIRAAFNVEVPLRTLFECPTIATLAEALSHAPRRTETQPIRRTDIPETVPGSPPLQRA